MMPDHENHPKQVAEPAGAQPPSQPGDIVAVAEQSLPIAALSDWVMFLQGPSKTLFPKNFEADWKRLFRMVALVLLMLGAIVAVFSLGLTASGQHWSDFSKNTKYLALVLVIGAVLAVPYSFILAPLLRIRINFAQTFFAVLLLGLPWLPLLALVWAVGNVWDAGLVVAIALYMFTLLPLYNFCKGAALIASCRLWRTVLSLLIPIVIALAIFLANHL